MKNNKQLVLLSFGIFLLSCPLFAQNVLVNISGTFKNQGSSDNLPFVNVVLIKAEDSTFVSGTITDDLGLFTLTSVSPGDYLLMATSIGFKSYSNPLYIGSNSKFINLGTILLAENILELEEVVVTGQQETISTKMDKKTFNIENNLSQSGGSALQAMSNLPGVSIQEGQVMLRGNHQVVILINGQQTAMTGFGNQNGLDNLPASSIQKIEIINNPSAKFDANGNAGIINIILKEKKDQGFNGQIEMNLGLGALGIKEENLPNIRPQYQYTPKINPSLSANYRKKNYNLFIQSDYLYNETLNKNEFVTRTYQNGAQIIQQLKRNRDTHYWTTNAGMDWFLNDHNQLTISGLLTQESIKDYGDQPFFNSPYTDQIRLWQFLEDEVLTAAMGSITYQHSFRQPGHQLSAGIHYTFDREDEKYFFTNTLPLYTTKESFFLIADQKVFDINLDYTKPLSHGLLEIGTKFRKRIIPTDMQFNPSTSNSILDVGADGLATYQEIIPAIYGNYTYEVKKLEMEIGLRIEYVDLKYEVDPNHNTYQSDGYQYFQPFPNARITYKINSNNKLSAFYNRRVDRPDEVDIRIFPKYDDAEIIKVGNPALQPQFTNSFELGYKNIGANGSFYTAIYHKISNGTITRMATSIEPSNLIYNISQNAGKSYNTGLEMVFQRDFSNKFQVNLNLNGYLNQIDPFTVVNLYPISHIFQGAAQKMYSGSIQLNSNLKIGQDFEGQMTVLYLAPNILPQGRIDARYSINMGFKKLVQNGRGALLLNIQDLLNTMVTSKTIQGNNFSYASTDYYETQVIRIGYQYKI